MWRTDTNGMKAARARETRVDGTGTPAKASLILDPTRTGREAEELETTLRRVIVGQDEAIEQIVNIYQMHLTGMNPPGRPIGNFLFLGPTGSGKTRIVEATAEALVRNPKAVIKIDCAEFQHSHEIAKLIGSPPGYLGHRETHPLLSQEVLNQHHSETIKVSFVLFDEIEKSSDALWNLLLGILDKATLTLGDNRRVDFSRAMIFMTSNLGAGEMSQLTQHKMGFGRTASPAAAVPVDGDDKLTAKVTRTGLEAARRKFTPEFMNRLDKVVVFRPLGEDQLRRILDLELNQVQQRIFSAHGDRPFVITATEEAKQLLLTEGTDVKYGARHLKRAIERLLVQPLSNLIATNQVRAGDWVKVDLVDGQIRFTREAESLPTHAMAEMVDSSVALPLAALASAISADQVRPQPSKTSRRS